VLVWPKPDAVDKSSPTCSTPLITAAFLNHAGVVTALVEHKAQLELKDARHGLTALASAAKYRQLDALRLLLKAGADPNASDVFGDSALSVGIKYEEVLTLLVSDPRANANLANLTGQLPLHKAAERGYVFALKLLLPLTKDVNARDQAGFSPLQCVVLGSHTLSLHYILYASLLSAKRVPGRRLVRVAMGLPRER